MGKMDFDKLAGAVALLTGPQGLSPQEMLTAFAVELMDMEPQEGQEYVEELRASTARPAQPSRPRRRRVTARSARGNGSTPSGAARLAPSRARWRWPFGPVPSPARVRRE